MFQSSNMRWIEEYLVGGRKRWLTFRMNLDRNIADDLRLSLDRGKFPEVV